MYTIHDYDSVYFALPIGHPVDRACHSTVSLFVQFSYRRSNSSRWCATTAACSVNLLVLVTYCLCREDLVSAVYSIASSLHSTPSCTLIRNYNRRAVQCGCLCCAACIALPLLALQVLQVQCHIGMSSTTIRHRITVETNEHIIIH